MDRNEYLIEKSDGTTIKAYANGYDVSAVGTLSLGQLQEFAGQRYTALVLSLQSSQWVSIYEMKNGRPSYLETGMIKSAGGLVVQ